jgi:hypothetical protein
VKGWLNKLIDRLTKKRNGLVVLRLSFDRQSKPEPKTWIRNAIPACPHCGVVPINWAVHNKWCRFVIETGSTETVLVGTEGVAVRVPADRAAHPQKASVNRAQSLVEKGCGEKSPTKEIPASYSYVSREMTPEQERPGARVLTRPVTGSEERQRGHTKGDSYPPQAVPEIRCINCDETKAQLAVRGDVGPCCRRPFWTVPYELIWRSLPGGEDR